MRTTIRCREFKESWVGRRRWYRCRRCGQKFQVDTRAALPQKERLCFKCQRTRKEELR